MKRIRAIAAVGATVIVWTVIFAGCATTGQRASAESPSVRGIWVTRWDYKDADDIRAIMKNVAGAGLNTVFFQVRGEGTLFYPSSVEPLDKRWEPGPEVDALKTAVAEAHKRGLKIHAWMNVMPAWRGAQKPPYPNQIVNAHPEWLIVNDKGERMKPQDGYIYITPGREDARKHVVDIASEIASKYDVDGVHLDYIRFPGRQYSYDKATLKGFENLTGQTPKESARNWDEYRRRLVTEIVKDVKAKIDAKPGVELSAAVWGDYGIGNKDYLQDTREWVRSGYLDFTAPMDYTTKESDFERRLLEHLTFKKGFPVYVGIGAYKFTEGKKPFSGIETQMDFARDSGGGGYVLFAYSSFFPGNKANSYGVALRKKLNP